MSLATQMMIADRYGVLLDIDDLADLLGYEPRTVQNMIYADKLGIRTSKMGAKTVAHYADVAAYVDGIRDAMNVAKVA